MSDVEPVVLLEPVVTGGPREWEITDEALLEQATERLPNDPTGLLFTEAAWQARQQLAARRWFLVRNEAGNEPARSVITNRKETYYTYLGIERPWHGLEDIGAWLRDKLDPQNTDPTIPQLVNAILGQWLTLGRIEPISEAQARDYSLRIYIKSHGRVDLFGRAQQELQQRLEAR
jgi:hypothetical protein